MQRIIKLAIYTAAIALITTSMFGQQKPPYIEKNRCPFECCRLGNWVAKSAMRAYFNEGDTTRVAFQIMPNDTIVAEIGNVHMEAVGRILVTKAIHNFNAGDTLIATQCAGEEDYEVWFQGKPYYVDVFWRSLYSPDEDEYEDEVKESESKFSGIMLSRPLMIWWVRVKNQHGQTGWLRLVNKTLYCFELEERIEGMDGCS